DLPRRAVDRFRRRLAVRLLPRQRAAAAEELALGAGQRDGPDRVAHPPAGHHAVGHARDLLQVVLGAGRAVAVDELLGRPPAERAHDAAAQVALGEVVAVVLWPLVGDPERLAARRDRHARDRVGAGHDEAEDRVAGLVVRDALALLGL